VNLEAEALKLEKAASVTFTAAGHSMRPQIEDGEDVTVVKSPPALFRVGDAVLVRVRGRVYLHKVIAWNPGRKRAQIGNNRGGVNGWVPFSDIYGVVRKGKGEKDETE
jgi:phage repressor protein C with HTH and peptisase S24 domain